MSYISHVDDRGFIRLTLSGSWPTLDELRLLRKDLDSRGPRDTVLADLRAVTQDFPYAEQVRSAVDLVRNDQASNRRRRAVLVGSDVQFGIARMFQALLPGEVEIFRDEQAAVDWLLQANPTSPSG